MKTKTYNGIEFSLKSITTEELETNLICADCCIKQECYKMYRRSICELKGLDDLTVPDKIINRK